uniref:Uncharacterized protein n=1 Tax=Sciurus vulgaris TaxID=55149 RepID=A0A8D2D762_SCIVU
VKAEVGKLELIFQKADSNQDNIHYRLGYEIKTHHPYSADLQLLPLTEEEKTVTEQLKSHMPDISKNELAKGN